MAKDGTDTFCVLPWGALEIRNDGSMSPCCFSEQVYRRTDGTPLNIREDSPRAAFEGPAATQLRENLARGIQDENCKQCWKYESAGRPSPRQMFNQRFGLEIQDRRPEAKQKLIMLDLKLGILCNQKCLICGPWASSLWESEIRKRAGRKEGAASKAERRRKKDWTRENPAFWSILKDVLPGVRELYLSGGETFLIRGAREILRTAVEIGSAPTQSVVIISNGSFFPDLWSREFFPHFKQVRVQLSLDGTGEQFEYQRFPARWTRAFSVYRRFKDSSYFGGINLTLSAYNIFYLREYLRFWKDQGEAWINLGFLSAPDYKSACILPQELKVKVAQKLYAGEALGSPYEEKLDAAMRFMLQSDLSSKWKRFLWEVENDDRFRKTSFARVFPEFMEAAKPFWNPPTSL